MKNNYFRRILWIGLILSFIYSIFYMDSYVIQHVPENQISIVADDAGNYSIRYGGGIDIFHSINGGIQTVLILPLYPLFVWGGFGFAIIFGYVGPILIFVSWLIVLFILSFIYSLIRNRQIRVYDLTSNGKLIIVCIVSIILLSFIQFRYQVSAERALFAPENDGKIISITPQNAKIGDTVRIVLSDADHEGYSYVSLIKYFEPGKGYTKKGTVWIGKIPQNNVITFILKSKNCFDMVLDERCDLFVDAVPDTYKLRVQSPGDRVLLESDFIITQ